MTAQLLQGVTNWLPLLFFLFDISDTSLRFSYKFYITYAVSSGGLERRRFVPIPTDITPITYAEFCQIRQRLARQKFRRLAGTSHHEVCFRSPEVNRFIVKVLTPCSSKKIKECEELSLFSGGGIVSGPTESIMGQVLIIDLRTGGEVYSSAVYRSPRFVDDFMKKIWLTWLRICHPPSCPECNIRMEIYRRRVNGQTWWGCRRDADHRDKKPIWMPWDIMLSSELKEIAKEMRKARRGK